MANQNFGDFRDLGKYQLDAFNTATSSTAKSLRAIAEEATDYSKQSLDNSRNYFEKLMRVQKIDDIVQLQSEFYRNAYGDFFARASRVGELCSNLAKEAFVSAQSASEQATKASQEAATKIIADISEQTEKLAAKAREAGNGEH
ncbi:phasin family protein [Methylosinus sporium]|uniref:Phasin family protein n=1 Tax=Methylosinus sporium TaxID=428 RepID=A0A549T055_METSR|nr:MULTISPECIES: phasin family protein [Methylosinus]MBU3888230.1 phasin family protein [Methylosinus sp. KRF6]TRL35249.1 phasin family protein [Methylosinus sporium]